MQWILSAASWRAAQVTAGSIQNGLGGRRRNPFIQLHWTHFALPLEHKAEGLEILSLCRFTSKQENCWKGRKFSLHLLQRTQKKPVSAATWQIAGWVHPTVIPGVWKKNLHAIRRVRMRHMAEHSEPWGSPGSGAAPWKRSGWPCRHPGPLWQWVTFQ